MEEEGKPNLGVQGLRSRGQRRQSCLFSLAPATLIGWVCQCTDIYLVGRRASFLLNQDAKNNRAQLSRAPAQPAPACPPWRPFSWVLRANCSVSMQLLVLGTSRQEWHCTLSSRLKRGLCKAYLTARDGGDGPLPEPWHSPPFPPGCSTLPGRPPYPCLPLP